MLRAYSDCVNSIQLRGTIYDTLNAHIGAGVIETEKS